MKFLLASHRLCTLFGIEVRIAYSLYLLALLFAMPGLQTNFGEGLALLLLPLWVVLHELGHCLAARSYGMQVSGITLHMLGGVSQTRGQIPGPLAEIVIAAAGPVVTLLLAVTGLAAGLSLRGLPGAFGQGLFLVNLVLLVFNLLPVFPLDGGRIALAVAVLRRGEERAIRLVRPLSQVGAGLIALYGFYEMLQGDVFGLMMVVIAFMLYLQGGQELQGRQYMQHYSRHLAAYEDSGYFRPGSAGGGREVFSREVPDPRKEGLLGRWWRERGEKKRARARQVQAELNARVDDVLAKVKAEGIASLTLGEKALLQKASEQYRKS